jgi:hypothetical protein
MVMGAKMSATSGCMAHLRTATCLGRLVLVIAMALAVPVAGAACPVTGATFKDTEGTAVARARSPDGKGQELRLRGHDGVVRSFTAPDNIDQIHPGALLGLCYTPGKEPYAVAGSADIRGATLIGTVQEVSGDKDKAWLVIRGQIPPLPTPSLGTLPTTTWGPEAVRVPAGARSETDMSMSLVVQEDLRVIAGAAHVGDRVRAVYRYAADQNASSPTLRRLEWQTAEDWGLFAPGALLLGAALLLLVVAWVFTGGHPAALFLGQDNRYSTSKFQTVLWFWMVLSAYLAVTAQRLLMAGASYVGGVDIPRNLLILSGISMLTFAASKAITTSKVEAAKADPNGASPDGGKPPASAAKIGDLVSDDFNRTDLGDFQLVTITGVAVVIYAISVVDFMSVFQFKRSISLPEVDATLLAIFGLGQAGYLGKKAAGDAGAGLTPQQAVQRAADLATAVSLNTAAVVMADEEAMAQHAASQASLTAATATPSTGAAAAEATRAQAAAAAARTAAAEAANAAKRLTNDLAEVTKLAEDWATDATAAAGTRSSQQAANTDAKSASARAAHAERVAAAAEVDAKATQAQVVTKTQP